MFQAAIDSLSAIIEKHAWVRELAGILPLSALIDFIEIPPKLHILELVGTVPYWIWIVTPSGGRLLLAESDKETAFCCQDQFGATTALDVLDGRYGDRYFASNPETLRHVLNAHEVTSVNNLHENMANMPEHQRIQELEIIHISRRQPRTASLFISWIRDKFWFYFAISFLGWLLLICLLVMSAFFKTWIAFAFLLLVPVTGCTVTFLFGTGPRRLLVQDASNFARLLLSAEHMNSSKWIVIYGESTLVNSLLNRPLKPNTPAFSSTWTYILRFVLRIFILGQWGLALAAAATENWNSYFICFWIVLSIICQAYLITPATCAKHWSKSHVNLTIKRFRTKTSTRRALLSTIVALNPGTFLPGNGNLSGEGTRWIYPILAPSADCSLWQDATKLGTIEARIHPGIINQTNFLSIPWNESFQKHYWHRYIPEGIYLAEKLRLAADLPQTSLHWRDLHA